METTAPDGSSVPSVHAGRASPTHQQLSERRMRSNAAFVGALVLELERVDAKVEIVFHLLDLDAARVLQLHAVLEPARWMLLGVVHLAIQLFALRLKTVRLDQAALELHVSWKKEIDFSIFTSRNCRARQVDLSTMVQMVY